MRETETDGDRKRQRQTDRERKKERKTDRDRDRENTSRVWQRMPSIGKKGRFFRRAEDQTRSKCEMHRGKSGELKRNGEENWNGQWNR